jgi:MYXO-CTERM domain-containing protein
VTSMTSRLPTLVMMGLHVLLFAGAASAEEPFFWGSAKCATDADCPQYTVCADYIEECGASLHEWGSDNCGCPDPDHGPGWDELPCYCHKCDGPNSGPVETGIRLCHMPEVACQSDSVCAPGQTCYKDECRPSGTLVLCDLSNDCDWGWQCIDHSWWSFCHESDAGTPPAGACCLERVCVPKGWDHPVVGCSGGGGGAPADVTSESGAAETDSPSPSSGSSSSSGCTVGAGPGASSWGLVLLILLILLSAAFLRRREHLTGYRELVEKGAKRKANLVMIGCLAMMALLAAGCGESQGAGDSTAQPGASDQQDASVTGVKDVACSTHAVWPVPACAPSCAAETFHVELPADDSYPADPVLFLPDGRTLVARAGQPGAEIAQATLVMLSADGTEEASATIEPCGEPVPVELADLVESGEGGFILLATCSPGVGDQRVVLVRLDAELAVADTENLLFGLAVERFYSRLAVLDGTLYLLYVTSANDLGPGTWTVHLMAAPGKDQAQPFELLESSQPLSTRALTADEGLLVFLIEGLQVQGESLGELDSVLVADGSGTVIARLDSERYGLESDLDFMPKAAHISGGDLIIAGQSWERMIGPDGWASREAVFQRRKLDGTVLHQTRIAMGPQTDLSGLRPMPEILDAPSAAAWLVIQSHRQYTKRLDGGTQLNLLPRFTWLTSELEARFGTLAPEGIPEIPMVLTSTCDCGYRIAWSGEDTLHVVRTNNLFHFGSDPPCDDGLACTSDGELDGICALDVATGCWGPDGCYDAGAPRDDNPCLVCGQNSECGFLWQPLVDEAACGIDGQCMDGRCRCGGRWIAAKGSSTDMHELLAAGNQNDGHVLALTRATKLQGSPKGKIHLLEMNADGEEVKDGLLPDSWHLVRPILVAENAPYVVTQPASSHQETLRQLDRKGTAVWSVPLPSWNSIKPERMTTGLVADAQGRVMAFHVGPAGQSLLVGAALISGSGDILGKGSWEEPFAELEGDVELGNPFQYPKTEGIQGLALPDGRFVILAGALQVPQGGDIGLHHEFMIIVGEDGKDATLKVLPDSHFAAAMAFGNDGFLTCRNLVVQEWTLEGEKKAAYDLADAVKGGKEMARSCRGLAPGSDGQSLMLVNVWDKTKKTEYGEVLVLGADMKLAKTITLPLLPSWKGISSLPDGDFLVTGSLDSGVAAVLRADADGNYRCW